MTSPTPLVATAHRVTQDSELYCDRCQTVLQDIPAGEFHFSESWCDCSWACCHHSIANGQVRGYSCHPAHLKCRPKTPPAEPEKQTGFTHVQRTGESWEKFLARVERWVKLTRKMATWDAGDGWTARRYIDSRGKYVGDTVNSNGFAIV